MVEHTRRALRAPRNGERKSTSRARRSRHLSPGDTDKPTGRIDWILIRDDGRGVEVRSHEILRDEAAGRYPSDHYPILVKLELAD